MKIQSVRLQNFRGFEDEFFSFADQFNLLVGDNGTGKTAILDALQRVFHEFTQAFNHETIPVNVPSEARLLRIVKGQTVTLEKQYPVIIQGKGILEKKEWQEEIVWNSEESGSLPQHQLPSIASQLSKRIRQGKDDILPLIAYYGTGRLWGRKEKNGQWGGLTSRTAGYTNCLNPTSNEESLLAWLKNQEAIALQQGQTGGVLAAVKKAIADCMENWQDVRYDFAEDDLLATSVDGSRTLPFRMLSDGERNMLAMVADIAHRAALLNPHLEAEATIETPGVVLIDEIDLHLHPKWQRRVVQDLKRTFPKVQFVATTHSPFIIQSLAPGELIDLNDDKPVDYYNKSIEDITEEVMNVPLPQRSQRYQAMMTAAEEYYRLLQQAPGANAQEIERLKQDLDELMIPFGDNPAYYAFLKMEREAAGLGNGDE